MSDKFFFEGRQDAEAQVAGAKLQATISVDTREGAVESINEPTAILNKGRTVTTVKPPSRNDVCNCGSGIKFKKYCG